MLSKAISNRMGLSQSGFPHFTLDAPQEPWRRAPLRRAPDFAGPDDGLVIIGEAESKEPTRVHCNHDG
jgi:hypothetical protein